MSALLPIAVVGSLAVAAELGDAPSRPGAQGSADRTRRLGGVLLLTAAATALAVWPRRAMASVQPAPGGYTPVPAAPSPIVTEPAPEPPSAPPAPASSAGGDDAFYEAVLRGLGAPWNSATQRFVYAWRQAEGGRARFNPFNTTQRMPGSVAYNTVGVQHYPDAATGVAATVKTLLNGRYPTLVASMREGRSARAMADALAASPWGTGALAQKVLAAQEAGAPVRRVAIATPSGASPTVVA